MGTIWSQSFFLPEPTLTEKNLPDQTGKVRTPHSPATLWHSPHSLSQPMLTSILQVHIVTGGYTGIGFELAQILYAKNSTVYIAGRSSSKGTAAISALKAACPHSQGRLEFLSLDLADLPTISKSAAEFTSKETRLDVLTNNAGVMVPPAGSTTAQGFELQMGTNCLGPFLFTLCLLPVLKKTARTAAPGSVRVTWAGSLGVEVFAPKGGVEFDEKSGAPKVLGSRLDYGQSKVGNVLIASEFAKRFGGDGIITVVCTSPPTEHFNLCLGR